MSSENLSTNPRDMATESLDPRQVETFLSEHPAFFKHRPELLTALELPHGGAGAVSLVERQVNLLRERNIEMRHKLASMTQHAEDNDVLFSGTRETVLRLLALDASSAIGDTIRQCFSSLFDAEMANLIWLESANDELGITPDLGASALTTVTGLIKHQQPFAGVFRAEEMAALFGESESDGSAALVPLIFNDLLVGVLTVGSNDVHRYDSNVGTLFLEYIADVIVHLPSLRAG